LRQRFDKRRFFFSGTPYGDFDEVPIEASREYLSQYKLLINFGWNTLIQEDYTKLLDYVKEGGTLLTGLPQFSTHVKRDFLRDMQDLALWNNGDLREFCGFAVKGRGIQYCGQWNGPGKEGFKEPDLSAMPNNSIDEDGPAYLAEIENCDAEVLAWDAATGAPMVLRHKVGKGQVICLALWAYPGHELFQQFSATWLAHLAEQNKGDIYVDDPSNEVFWTIWKQDDNAQCLMLLNTDWTVAGNTKHVNVRTPDSTFPLDIQEGKGMIVTLAPNGHSISTCEF
jgi:hypothetical protein